MEKNIKEVKFKKKKKKNSNKKNQWIISIILLLVFFITSSINSIILFITNFEWFDINNYLSVFLLKIKTELLIAIIVFILLSISLYFYMNVLKKKFLKNNTISLSEKFIKRFNIIVSILFSGFMAFKVSTSLWLKINIFKHAIPFDKVDPLFHKDISFYMFKLPFYKEIIYLLISLFAFLIMLTIAYTIFLTVMRTVNIDDPEVKYIYPHQHVDHIIKTIFTRTNKKQLLVLGVCILIFIAILFQLKVYDLVYSDRGVAYGASYTDVNVSLIAYHIMSIVSLLMAAFYTYLIIKNKFKKIIIIPIALFVVLIGNSAIGYFVQQLIVEPDEINKEKIYLEYNIKNTQEAFSLDNVKEEQFPVEQKLNYKEIEHNKTTISNIRINDQRPLKQTYNQIQGIRLYYSFKDIDVDRYTIDGIKRQVFIAPRELNQENLSAQAKTWINQHLKYTHGYGIVMSPVNEVTNEGQPRLFIKNIPPVSDIALNTIRPEIYFGELSNNYIVINTKEDEFDYPEGSDNKTTRYEGKAGIKLNGINKLLFSIREKSMKLLVSSLIDSESRIIINRDILKRVHTIAPFIDFDNNPYLVLNEEDAKLYWIIDGYMTSSYYPYSQVFSYKDREINYIRNSVKVVIDAYEGTTDFYAFDEEDALLTVYNNIFPDLFKKKEEFPTGLLDHIKYPQDYFDIQTQVFRAYHVNNPEVFYNGEDNWDVANEKYMDVVQPIESNYVMFKLPDSEEEEFALIVPYTPKQKANMTSLLVGRNDGENYGKLYIYKFPKDKTVQGPMMIESRIDQDSSISPQFTLWGQEGSNVLRGNLIVVPVNHSLLYVEPIYLQADNPNSLPEMKRVIVSYEDNIVMETSLEKALKKLFNKTNLKIDLDDNKSPEVKELINRLNDLLKQSNEINEEMEEIVNQLNKELNK